MRVWLPQGYKGLSHMFQNWDSLQQGIPDDLEPMCQFIRWVDMEFFTLKRLGSAATHEPYRLLAGANRDRQRPYRLGEGCKYSPSQKVDLVLCFAGAIDLNLYTKNSASSLQQG
jgi:hypothetical protein